MAKKKARKKSSRKAPKESGMQTLSLVSVHIANDLLKERKKEMEGSPDEIDWDGGLEDLWRALVSTYWAYGEEEIKAFLKQELTAIKKIHQRLTSKEPEFRLTR